MGVYDTLRAGDSRPSEVISKAFRAAFQRLDQRRCPVLRSHVNMLNAERAVAGEHYQDHGAAVLLGRRPATAPGYDHRPLNRLADAAGLPHIRLHDVRHSYATAGRLARVDPKALSQRVGHASVSFTMEIYMHRDLEADREVAHALASVRLAGLPEVGAGENR